ncbi:MgtC/SapB family protein [Nocardioides cheoyonin]|uniref:MgtC/SapB family protein n=1 Tax=Nocardioides cheoyonin TaxID=3156615 RepID=UPI0032B398B7
MELLTIGEPTGQGWLQLGELGLALVLSTCIGLERELRQKAAGLRTHTLVGVGAALFMLVSKYAFTDVLGDGVVLDPSRVAAQIVSGIGFIGGGLIFVRRDVVSGLTTAASVWLTAAVGSAAGGGLPVLAVATTALYFVAVPGYTALVRRLPGSRLAPAGLALGYEDGRGVLREVIAECTTRGFAVSHLTTKHARTEEGDVPGVVRLWMEVQGRGSLAELAASLAGLSGVLEVDADSRRE